MGIQSVEKLFESIFSNMQLSFQNIRVVVANQEQQLSLSIKNISFSNDNSNTNLEKETEKNFSKKVAVLSGLMIDIETPISHKGNVIDLHQVFVIYFSFLYSTLGYYH